MNRLYVVSPLGAFARGIGAGVAGTLVMNLYFKYTARWMPPTPPEAFTPPEEQQKQESSMVTVARRVGEHLMQRGPMTEEQKQQGGQAVHLGFGAAWGGLYGLARETFPALNGPAGVAGLSTLVWMVGDNVILPGFRLAAWPRAYSWKSHAYALAAHFAYGTGVWSAYEATRRPTWDVLLTGVLALGTQRKLRRFLPRKAARPAARAIVDNLVSSYVSRPVQRARAAIASA